MIRILTLILALNLCSVSSQASWIDCLSFGKALKKWNLLSDEEPLNAIEFNKDLYLSAEQKFKANPTLKPNETLEEQLAFLDVTLFKNNPEKTPTLPLFEVVEPDQEILKQQERITKLLSKYPLNKSLTVEQAQKLVEGVIFVEAKPNVKLWQLFFKKQNQEWIDETYRKRLESILGTLSLKESLTLTKQLKPTEVIDRVNRIILSKPLQIVLNRLSALSVALGYKIAGIPYLYLPRFDYKLTQKQMKILVEKGITGFMEAAPKAKTRYLWNQAMARVRTISQRTYAVLIAAALSAKLYQREFILRPLLIPDSEIEKVVTDTLEKEIQKIEVEYKLTQEP
jgi:hypothetical protein